MSEAVTSGKVAGTASLSIVWVSAVPSRRAVAYLIIWIVYLGAICVQEGWVKIIHRPDRCDLSLFQLGLRFTAHDSNTVTP